MLLAIPTIIMKPKSHRPLFASRNIRVKAIMIYMKGCMATASYHDCASNIKVHEHTKSNFLYVVFLCSHGYIRGIMNLHAFLRIINFVYFDMLIFPQSYHGPLMILRICGPLIH